MEASLSQPKYDSERDLENYELPENEIGNQGLKKQILVQGHSWQSPSHGDEVEGTKFN